MSVSDEQQRMNRGLGAEAVRPCAGGKEDSKAKRCVVAQGVESRQTRARPQACGQRGTWRAYSHLSGPLVLPGQHRPLQWPPPPGNTHLCFAIHA